MLLIALESESTKPRNGNRRKVVSPIFSLAVLSLFSALTDWRWHRGTASEVKRSRSRRKSAVRGERR